LYLENPNPYIFRLGDFGIRWYGFLLALSMAVGTWYVLRRAQKRGWNEDVIMSALLYSIIMGVVGARAIYVITNWPAFAASPADMIRIDHGGLSWHGGLLGGVGTGWLYLRRAQIDFFAALDLVVPGLTLGYTLVRIANILNQEILGRYAEILGTRHPAQIYGSAIGAILLIRYFLIQRNDPPSGYQFWSFFFWYSILRALIEETFRANPLYALGYVNEYWGAGLFTLTHLVTPPLLLIVGFFMYRSRDAGDRK